MDRIERRENLIRKGILKSDIPSVTHPACSRYDDSEDDVGHACVCVYFYALGLLTKGPSDELISSSILRLHQHRGELYVVWRKPLPESVRRAFNKAWKYINRAQPGEVSFVSLGSPDWRDVWNKKRFKSSWIGVIEEERPREVTRFTDPQIV